MKIRLQRGSVRFRLRQPEVQALLQQGRLEEPLALGTGTFVMVLELRDCASVGQKGSSLEACVPTAEARAWATGDAVGLNYTLPEGTRLIVEKDWACREPAPGASDSGTFPRPPRAASDCGAS